ncbi:YceI family protein [Tamlana sp. 2_MG-2023]|uniref:YceI family protein n=1 Tax=unclassified Tamlana TaxID=2614803 RepID=UPI0026E296CF|nr:MULTISPECIES: YceI family protein [unclassified Tamlana]MDO6759246.1 YceI family protein [Tamlana sp. 2_MG-2023]MDO6790615.1 YceI family protein [Tamlana sp. 1_MG-2023]
MKNTIKKLAVVALVTVFASSFTTIGGEKKAVKTEESTVVWKGYKVTGSHEGTIAIKSGTLEFDKDKLVGGEFVIDMTTISSTDLEGEYKGKLDGHLKSDDFFGVEKFPTSKLVFKKVKASGKNAYNVTGDLTVKGKTHAIDFTISIYGSKATASLKIDRTKYDIRYGSASFFDDLADKAIYDEFDIVADLEF